MTATTAVFTSIAANYLPKARVLARSVKQVAPDAYFVLMMVDSPPAEFRLEAEPFDELMTLLDLGVDDVKAWAFSHSVVELCTAVKGKTASRLLARDEIERIFYFDPDIVIFDRFTELEQALSETSILLTPHQSEPELHNEAVMDNEMASLKHGVFNMGFFGIADTSQGRQFASWWSDRLSDFCLDDIASGLFTDQKWANLIPCFFDDYRVLRSPAFNVATWNITTREVAGSLKHGLTVNGEPLGFYHFSGFDSGDQALMLNKYGADSPALNSLRAWYVKACSEEGQGANKKLPYGYGTYDDGSQITSSERRLYRARVDLQHAFPDPFSTQQKGGFRHWYRTNMGAEEIASSALCISNDTTTSDALNTFSSWMRQRGLANTNWLKRSVLLALSRFLRLVSRSAS